MRRALAIAPIAVALLIAACGSSKSTTSPSSSKPASSATGGASGTAANAATTAPATLISTKTRKGLGTIVAVGPNNLTVYMFAADKGSTSSCTGAPYGQKVVNFGGACHVLTPAGAMVG